MKWIMLIFIFHQIYLLLSHFKQDHYKKYLLESLHSQQISLSIVDRLFLKFEYTSGMKDIIPSITIYNFSFIALCLGCFTFFCIFNWIHLIDVAIIFGGLMIFLPWLLLDLMIQKRDISISKEMTHFISTMARWSFVQDDIYYCFDKSISSLHGPTKHFIQEFLLQIQYSGHVNEAYNWLLLQSNNVMYRNFIINIKQADQSKGNLHQLLIRLEEEAYLIEGEYSRRLSETFFDRLVIYATILLVIVLSIVVLWMSHDMQVFYLKTGFGNRLLSIFALLFVAGIVSASRMNDFNY